MKKVNCAWMSCGNGVEFEIFEFQDPKTVAPKTTEAEPFDYTRGGFFHIAVTTADPNATVKKVIETGGKQIGQTVEMFGEPLRCYTGLQCRRLQRFCSGFLVVLVRVVKLES